MSYALSWSISAIRFLGGELGYPPWKSQFWLQKQHNITSTLAEHKTFIIQHRDVKFYNSKEHLLVSASIQGGLIIFEIVAMATKC